MRRVALRGLTSARQLGAMLRVLCDWRSRLAFLRLKVRREEDRSGRTVALRLRALGGRPLHVRPGTSDTAVVVEDFVHGFADPPAETGPAPRRIVELGSNIGAGLARLAERYPSASLLGVEADPANAELARRNIAPWADRCRLVEAMVWEGPGEPIIDRTTRLATGFTVRARENGDSAAATGVAAVSVHELLGGFARTEPIDYLYLDLEGTHEQLLKGWPAWTERVKVIKVAAHLGTEYSERDCARDLERLGFRTRLIALDPTGWTVGVRG